MRSGAVFRELFWNVPEEQPIKSRALSVKQEACLWGGSWVMGSGWAQPRVGGHGSLDYLTAEDRESQLGLLSRDVPF